jgi:uncharacterized protein (DUF1697 family)
MSISFLSWTLGNRAACKILSKNYSGNAMTTIIALLRGINVGGNGKLKMDVLRTLCGDIGLLDARTYIQSGNVVFRSADPGSGECLAGAIERTFGIRTTVVTRTAAELRAAVERNPISGVKPNQLLLSFLTAAPTAEAVEKVRQMEIVPEEIHIIGREMYIHFPLGQGVSKMPMARIERTLGVTGTGRNWTTVLALLAMAESATPVSGA